MNVINIIEHADGEMKVSTAVIANGMELEHRQVIRAVRNNINDLRQFGRVDFEDQPFVTAGGEQRREVAHLNEHQATFLLTSFRNIGRVKEFKVELVKQFYVMRQALAAAPMLSEDEIVHQALAITAARVETLKAEVQELTPRAESWDQLADASGTYTVTDAGKLLASAGCQTGPRKLFEQLRDLGWIFKRSGIWTGKQDKINAGLLQEYAGSHFHPRTGERVLDAPTVRVTVDGLGKLREFFGAPAPLLEVAP